MMEKFEVYSYIFINEPFSVNISNGAKALGLLSYGNLHSSNSLLVSRHSSSMSWWKSGAIQKHLSLGY